MLRFITLAALLGSGLPAGAQDRAAWMQQARWGVMTHYLADWMARAHSISMRVEEPRFTAEQVIGWGKKIREAAAR